MSRKIFWIFTVSVALVFSFSPCCAGGQNASDTRKITQGMNSQSTGDALINTWLNDMPDVTDTITRDDLGAGISEIADTIRDKAVGIEDLRNKIKAQPTGSLSDAMKSTRGGLLNESGKVIDDLKKEATWFDKFNNALEVINVVGVGAKAAGHAWEGDWHGAGGAVLDEFAKKIATGIGTILVSPVPVIGPVAGASLGEEFHDKVTKPALESAVDKAREQDAKEKMLNSGIPQVTVMGNSGARVLPDTMYVDPETGLIKERTPEQQRAYREMIGEDIKSRETSDHPLDAALRELKAGKITQTEFDRKVNEYNKPGRSTKDYEKYKTKKSKIQEKIEKMLKPKEADRPKDADRVLESVIPAKVTASTATELDIGNWAKDNIVNTVITITFWNLGSYAPGYEKAVMTVQSSFSAGGKDEAYKFQGTFSGGPNGKFVFSTGDGTIQCQLNNGTTITVPDSPSATVQNPEAFKNWPR